jgi:hypothetical protein
MKILFTFIVFIHGLIHIMGFLKAFHIAEINQLQTTISKPIGVLWLLATILFVLALAMC